MDKVVHFEIPADDMARAKKFYSQVFGWQINKVPMPDVLEGEEYNFVTTVDVDENNMPKTAGAINGGMLKRMAKGDATVIVINVQSVDDYLKKVEQAGGKVIMPKQQVGNMGLYARVSDTEGNVVGLWQDLNQ